MTIHPIPPIYDKNSRILILGSFPSVKSREEKFFYAHPQNRFWKVLSAVVCDALPKNTDEKRSFLIRHRIALWDVIASCDIDGSADSTIRGVTVNDIARIVNESDIAQIFVNGKTAEKYYNKYIKPDIAEDAVCLPSTSPANAAWNLERLIEKWSVIKNYIEN